MALLNACSFRCKVLANIAAPVHSFLPNLRSNFTSLKILPVNTRQDNNIAANIPIAYALTFVEADSQKPINIAPKINTQGKISVINAAIHATGDKNFFNMPLTPLKKPEKSGPPAFAFSGFATSLGFSDLFTRLSIFASLSFLIISVV